MWTAWLLLTLNGLFFTLRLAGNTGSFPRALTREEEQDFLERMARGDTDARDELIEHNLRLVAHIVKKYYTPNGDQDDLISIGTIGLIKGVSTFKPDKNVRLATYASRCIENAILTQWPAMRLRAPGTPPVGQAHCIGGAVRCSFRVPFRRLQQVPHEGQGRQIGCFAIKMGIGFPIPIACYVQMASISSFFCWVEQFSFFTLSITASAWALATRRSNSPLFTGICTTMLKPHTVFSTSIPSRLALYAFGVSIMMPHLPSGGSIVFSSV